jgi:hypothetical protein
MQNIHVEKQEGKKYPVKDATLVAREALGLARAELAEILRSLAPGTWRHIGTHIGTRRDT